MARYYIVQAHHSVRGWVDLPSLASLHKAEADRHAVGFSERRKVITRVVRKAHGWVPPEEALPEPSAAHPEAAAPESVEGPEAPLRRQQKAKQRRVTLEARRPTLYDRIMLDWFPE